ncbi:NAD(P)/FAD-dependent oxidoreductase [Streptomyces sp. NPDC102402]|uniref:NAD(P)/FAD-dependent oxidoreductase n=1 Tax=Streptomyces sp. NPDC102402 TaxID=3366169 RepID=UPI0038000F66
MSLENIVIVGGGLAGSHVSMALRDRGYRGALTLVGAEPHPPYDRPPLTKSVLLGGEDAEDGTSFPVDWEGLSVGLRLGERAEALDLHDHKPGGVLRTTAGTRGFDGLVLATGAEPVRLPGEGRQHVVRTVDDVRALRPLLRPGTHVALVGAGWIGAEVATVAAVKGCRVTVVESARAPLAAAVGNRVGAWTAPWYAAAGVTLLCGTAVASVDHGGLRLADGRFLDADVVVTGIGARPAVGWLRDSGLEVARGVVVDRSLRASRAGVVALGDCAAWWSDRYGRHMVVEHWDTALKASGPAAAALLGEDVCHDPLPYFWSEQFGRTLQYVGDRHGADRTILRGSPQDPDWTVLWLEGELLRAALTVDRPRDLVQARRALTTGCAVDLPRATDPSTPLRDALRAA